MWSASKHRTKKMLLEPHSSDCFYSGHCMINFYFLPSHVTTDKQHSSCLQTYVWKDRSPKISQYATEEQQIWLNTWITAHDTEEKNWLLRLWPWENNFPFQHLAITATSSAGGTHQLKVSLSVLWGASESSTQHPVLWLIPTAPEEGNQAIRKGKNTIFFTFLRFLTCDLKYIAIPTYIYE